MTRERAKDLVGCRARLAVDITTGLGHLEAGATVLVTATWAGTFTVRLEQRCPTCGVRWSARKVPRTAFIVLADSA